MTPSTMTPCAISPCQNSGKLTYSINKSQPSCECRDWYSGNNCQVTPCTDVYCYNGGTCLITGNTSIYECPDEISGGLSQITPCTFSPCHNHGKCSVSGSGYQCVCVDWFSGTNCTDYMCDFETTDVQSCVFEQEHFNTFVWQITSGQNFAGYGPHGAAAGTYYYLLTAGYRPPVTTVRLVSRYIILESPKCLTFKYHSYGLRFRVYTNKYMKQSLFSSTIMKEWQLVSIQIPIDTNKITFEVTFGYSYSHPYVSLDSMNITDC